ncbi:hypothetical protein BY996DRAFT_2921491 [Phakopsora pachyrhizi]|nr:hypothetical protein BY996DRAFT_2921491 [Phakopsora pachyrhizi]
MLKFQKLNFLALKLPRPLYQQFQDLTRVIISHQFLPVKKIPKVLGEIPIIGTPRLPLPPLLPHPTRPHGPHHSSTAYSDMRRAAAAILKSRMIHPKCPEGMRACPAPKKKALGMMPDVLRKMVKDDEWECMEVNELVSCGGCTSEGTGVDCTKLPGVDGVGCEDSKCKIFTCLDSHIMKNGKCEPKKD